jgi:hypothetical protein
MYKTMIFQLQINISVPEVEVSALEFSEPRLEN